MLRDSGRRIPTLRRFQHHGQLLHIHMHHIHRRHTCNVTPSAPDGFVSVSEKQKQFLDDT